MSEYLQAGICYNVKVSKMQMKKNEISYEEVLKELAKEIPMDLYEIHEFENGYVFSLKNEAIEQGELPEFLMSQYKLFDTEGDEAREIIIKLNDLNKSEDVIEFAKAKRYQNFQYSSLYNNIYCGKWGNRLMIEYELIVFFLAGKIEMECYDTFLSYLEKLIKKDNPFRISDTIKVLIG